MAELLVWPALIGYGEAALAYAGALRGPGSVGKLGIWGVRIGWLAQTALLIAQARDSEGFPWGTWAGALNLFVWLVVGAYLIWGCTPRYRLLGLVVMPFAAALLIAAWAGGGTGVNAGDTAGWLLALHVGLMLAGFAGLTLAAGLAGLYLWQERRLKHRDASVLRLRLPALDSLDRLSARTATLSLGLLTVGMIVGLASFSRGDFDVAMAAAIGTWAYYAVALLLRRELRVRGRRFALLLVGGFVLVAVVLPLTHFAS
jgi:ABC-type uncharacterized transport system permease subunit